MNTDGTTTIKISTALFRTVILLEIAYLYLRTKLMHTGFFHELTSIEGELARSCVRAVILVAVLIACWHFKAFPNFFTRPKFNRTTIVLMLLLLIEALIAPKAPLTGQSVQLTFAATTIFVAVREELVYRYVIQNWLEGWAFSKNRIVVSILVTSMVFTLCHFGAQPLSSFPWIFFASILLGAIYLYSGKSISLVIACHFIGDLFFV